ncbi:MAG: glucosaminidase domain-containing protein [Treponemataceae bacterium]
MNKFYRIKKIFYSALLFFAVFFIGSCMTITIEWQNPNPDFKQNYQVCSLSIDTYGVKGEDALYNFFLDRNPDVNKQKLKRMVRYYVEEAKAEGINSDVAFVQMCLETGFLRFGNLVSAKMNNFCGLGSINEKNRGLSFKTERLGVKAHVQHLHAYGTTRTLNGKLIDSRYKYVNPKGKAPTVYELSGTWASDKSYGKKLANLLEELSAY